MGFGSVVLIEMITTWFWPRRTDERMLAKLAAVATWGVVAFLAVRLVDLVVGGHLAAALAMPRRAFFFSFFGLEVLVNLMVIALFAPARRRSNPGVLFGGSLLLVFAGSLYRFDTYLTANLPKPSAIYFPSLWEITNSIGWAAIGVAVYVVMAKRFPILSGVVVPKAARSRSRAAAAG